MSGSRQGRLMSYLRRMTGAARRKRRLLAERAIVAAEFDRAFYLAGNPDIAASGADPLDHFLLHGWREGRDPNPRFSVSAYLETYPDIAEAGVNPLVHYVQAGRAEGRKPRNDLGFRYQVLANNKPMETRLDEALARNAAVKFAPEATLEAAAAASRTGLKALHITFSHDDYTANLGGVQLCLQREDARVAAIGRDHLHLFPATHWPLLRTAETAALGVLLNGQLIGAFPPRAVADLLRRRGGPCAERSLAVHSLLGHAVDEVVEIAEAAGLRAVHFWLHDFASLCAGYHLMRNDVQDCGAPPPDSPACGICLYGPWRARHLSEHERLFSRLEVTVVSPSTSALEFWRASWRFPPHREVVLPHARLTAPAPAAATSGRPFRLAFAGLPSPHKGWPVFRSLAAAFADDPRYAFVHLGARQAGGAAADFRPVTVTEQTPFAMREGLAEVEADAVLVWPLCRETFSFTAYEAVAAGCAILTNPDSGNVAAMVSELGAGRVLADEAALAAAFESGEILDMSRARRRPSAYQLEFSALTVDLLREPA